MAFRGARTKQREDALEQRNQQREVAVALVSGRRGGEPVVARGDGDATIRTEPSEQLAGDVLVAALDVARELKREGRGFDLNPTRPEIVRADARALPLDDASAQAVFMDPPYGDHIDYSSDPRCIGKLSAYDPKYYQAMRGAFDEAYRVLKPGGVLAVYVCDYFETKKGLAPVGFGLFSLFTVRFIPVDIVSVVRRNKSLLKGNFHQAAERDNFFLRGFNYLFIARKPDEAPRRPQQRPRSPR